MVVRTCTVQSYSVAIDSLSACVASFVKSQFLLASVMLRHFLQL